ncbi:hypothetical protein [Helicobacter pylori]
MYRVKNNVLILVRLVAVIASCFKPPTPLKRLKLIAHQLPPFF